MCSFADMISIIVDVFTIVSVVFAYFFFKNDHERSRREASVDLIMKWSNSLNEKASLAKKYVEKLSKKQIEHLYAQEKVHFDKSNEDEKELCRNIKKLLMCGNDKADDEDGEFFLCEEESSELRWLIISYLNMLESILVAWQHRSADDTIIEQEFKYMFDLSKGRNILRDFRIVAGSEDCYPAIEMFYIHLEEKRKKMLKRKKKI